MIDDWLAVDETPDVVGKATPFLLHREKGAGVLPGAVDLEPVANDAGVGQQFVELPVGVTGDFVRVEAVEQCAVALPLSQYSNPGETCLRAFKHQEFEERLVVVQGHTPLGVMVGHIQFVGAAPVAALRHPVPLRWG